jgi:GDP-D-mannose dehydratase
VSLEDVLFMMAGRLGVRPVPEIDPALVRPNDVPHLVGDAAKLRDATGWTARVSLEDTLREVLDAQAD